MGDGDCRVNRIPREGSMAMNIPQVNRLAASLYTGDPADVRTVVREYVERDLIPVVDVGQLDDPAVRRVALNAVNGYHENRREYR